MGVIPLLLAALGEEVVGLVGCAMFPLLSPLISVLTIAGPPLPVLLAPLAAPLALAPLLAAPGCQIPPFQWRY
jgi:hypothetical protein